MPRRTRRARVARPTSNTRVAAYTSSTAQASEQVKQKDSSGRRVATPPRGVLPNRRRSHAREQHGQDAGQHAFRAAAAHMRTLDRSCVSDCGPPILRPAQVDEGAHHDGHLVGLHGTMLPAPLGVPTRGTLPSCPPTPSPRRPDPPHSPLSHLPSCGRRSSGAARSAPPA